MSYEIISYVLIGGLFTAIMIPLVALLRKTKQEQKHLDEVKTSKKSEPRPAKEDVYAFVD